MNPSAEESSDNENNFPLFQLLNETYLDIITNLHQSFVLGKPDDIKPLTREFNFVTKVIDKFGIKNQKIYKHIKDGFSEIAERIYQRDQTLFEGTTHYVALFNFACLYEVYPRMKPDERDILWTCLCTMAQHICTLNGTKTYIGSFTRIANSFLQSNPGLTQNDNIQQKLFSQMFTNPALSQEVQKIMTGDGVSSIRENMIEIVRGQGLTASKIQKHKPKSEIKIEQIPTSEEEDDDEDVAEETKTDTKKQDIQDITQMFAQMSATSKTVSKKARRKHKAKQATNVVQKIITKLEQQELTPQKIDEIKQIAGVTFSDDQEHAEKRNNLRSLFTMFGDATQYSSPADIPYDQMIAQMSKISDSHSDDATKQMQTKEELAALVETLKESQKQVQIHLQGGSI